MHSVLTINENDTKVECTLRENLEHISLVTVPVEGAKPTHVYLNTYKRALGIVCHNPQ